MSQSLTLLRTAPSTGLACLPQCFQALLWIWVDAHSLYMFFWHLREKLWCVNGFLTVQILSLTCGGAASSKTYRMVIVLELVNPPKHAFCQWIAPPPIAHTHMWDDTSSACHSCTSRQSAVYWAVVLKALWGVLSSTITNGWVVREWPPFATSTGNLSSWLLWVASWCRVEAKQVLSLSVSLIHVSREWDMNAVIVAAGEGPGKEKGFLAWECWTGLKYTCLGSLGANIWEAQRVEKQGIWIFCWFKKAHSIYHFYITLHYEGEMFSIELSWLKKKFAFISSIFPFLASQSSRKRYIRLSVWVWFL